MAGLDYISLIWSNDYNICLLTECFNMGFIIECNTLVAGTVGFFLQGKMSVK